MNQILFFFHCAVSVCDELGFRTDNYWCFVHVFKNAGIAIHYDNLRRIYNAFGGTNTWDWI